MARRVRRKATEPDVVVKESSIPRGIAILTVLMILAIGLSSFIGDRRSSERDKDTRSDFQKSIQEQVDANSKTAAEAHALAVTANQRERRLEKLIGQLVKECNKQAPTPTCVAIIEFQRQAQREEARRDGSSTNPKPSDGPRGSNGGSPSPSPSKRPHKPPSSSQPSPGSSPIARVCVDAVLIGHKCVKTPPLRTVQLSAASTDQKGAPVGNGALSATAIAVLASVLISPLVGKITKATAPPWLKAGLAYGLATLVAVLSDITLLDHQRWQYYVTTIAAAFVTHVTSHQGIVKLNNGKAIGQTGASASKGLTVGTRTKRRRAHSDAGHIGVGVVVAVLLLLVLFGFVGGFALSPWWFFLLLLLFVVYALARE